MNLYGGLVLKCMSKSDITKIFDILVFKNNINKILTISLTEFLTILL